MFPKVKLLIIGALYMLELECHDTDTLVYLTVAFRHGNRTGVEVSYPKDPYKNESYYPYGFGELTNNGKRKAYALGKQIREQYNSFLGSWYFPNIVEATSTDMNRTKATLMLVLAGLFPPANTGLEWDDGLNWQPIPFNYIPLGHDDHVLSFALQYCPKYIEVLSSILKTQEGKHFATKYEGLIKYLKKHTGQDMDVPFLVVFLYSVLATQSEFGLTLPSWTKKVYPEQLEQASGDAFALMTSTTKLKQLSGGFLLQKIVNDMQAKIDNKLSPAGRKIVLYSAHDITVVYLLSAMNVFFPHYPPYSACVFIELHQIQGVYGVKIFYEDYTQPKPKLLTVPGCEEFCPFQKFISLLQSNFPVGNNPCNDIKPTTC